MKDHFDGSLISNAIGALLNGMTCNVVDSLGTGTVRFLDTSSFMGFIKTLAGGWLGLIIANAVTSYT